MRALQVDCQGLQSAKEIQTKTEGTKQGAAPMARHQLSDKDRLKGLKNQLKSNKVPKQLKKGLEERNKQAGIEDCQIKKPEGLISGLVASWRMRKAIWCYESYKTNPERSRNKYRKHSSLQKRKPDAGFC